jgi:hypothetical protein
MIDVARAIIREPDVANATAYRHRVNRLAATYVVAFSASVTGMVLLVWRGRLFVTLSQRSNVETLTIAFFLLLFAYLALLTARAAWGAFRIATFRLRALAVRDPGAVERRKIAALGSPRSDAAVALNLALERIDQPGEPFEIEVADDVAPVGRLRIDGVRVQHSAVHRDGSNNLLAFFVRQVAEVLRIDPDLLEIVQWKAIDEEGWHQYVATADAISNLGRRLGDNREPVWPHLKLTPEQCDEVGRRLSRLCPTIRDEAFLPQFEFEAEHKVPIIPEPLGIVSLQRRESRVDPLSSMTSVTAVVLLVVGIVIWFIVRPPWVPGA